MSTPDASAASEITCLQRPQGITMCELSGGDVNLWPTIAIASISKSPAVLAPATAATSAQILVPNAAFSKFAPQKMRPDCVRTAAPTAKLE